MRFNVREVVFDPWRLGRAAQEIEREVLTVAQFPHTDARMIPFSSRLHAAIAEQRITSLTTLSWPATRPDVIAQHAARLADRQAQARDEDRRDHRPVHGA